MERSLILLKPDTYIRGLRPIVLQTLASRGLEVEDVNTLILDQWIILELWTNIHTLWGWLYAQEYLCGIPLEAMILRGHDAIPKTCEVKRQLRERFCDIHSSNMRVSIQRLIHCCDTPEDFEREVRILFPGRRNGS